MAKIIIIIHSSTDGSYSLLDYRISLSYVSLTKYYATERRGAAHHNDLATMTCPWLLIPYNTDSI